MSQQRPTVDLSRFDNSKTFDPGAGFVKRTLWYFTHVIFFLNPGFPFRSPKPALLRLFVAKVGTSRVIHPGVNIKFAYVDVERNLLGVAGSVPGGSGTVVVIKPSVKAKGAK